MGFNVLTVDTWHRGYVLHHGRELPLQVILQNLGSSHGLVHRDTRDVPTANDEIIGVDHRQHLRDRYKDILASLWVGTESEGGGSDERSDIVWLLQAVLGVPRDIVLVGEVGRENGGTVVSSETDK